MAVLSTLSTLAPYHLILYSILFGSTTYQSFFAGIVAFKTLPYHNFGALQAKIFPPYFSLQAIASAVLLLTKPIAFTGQAANISLGISALGGLINLVVFTPMTRQIMELRKKQEGIDGKLCRDPDPSPEMAALNSKFRKIHGASVLLNTAAFLSLAFYGVVLTDGFLSV